MVGIRKSGLKASGCNAWSDESCGGMVDPDEPADWHACCVQCPA